VYVILAGSCVVTEVSKCEGEAMVNNRKGRLIFFYEWNLELKWKAGDKDDKKLSAQGKVTIPNMSEENSIEEVDVSYILFYLCILRF
jgi:activator of HSP90 ATPase